MAEVVFNDTRFESNPIRHTLFYNGSDPRKQKLLRNIPFTAKILEVGPNYAPIASRREGFNTINVDFATADVLRANSTTPELIEEVDFVWNSGYLHEQIPKELWGKFDVIISSHVFEHLPDKLGFLISCHFLLKPGGVIIKAIPYMHVCFDMLHPHTTTGEILQAYSEKRTRHDRKTHFDHMALMVNGDNQGGWAFNSKPNFTLVYTLEDALNEFNKSIDANSPYRDSHSGYFTPSSLQLIMLDLQELKFSPWHVDIEVASGVEFYAWFTRRTLDPNIDIQAKRLDLMKRIIREQQIAIDLISTENVEKKVTEISTEKSSEKSQELSTEIFTVSAIIPIYNGGQYIEDAIDSVLDQTYPVKELIIVDDGSTDNSREIVEKIIAKHSDRKISFYSKENGGQSSARNYGVKHSSGTLIAFLDQDDMWTPDHLEELIRPFIEQPKVQLGWVYSNLDEVNEQGAMVTRSFLSTIGTTHPKEDIFTFIREDCFILPSASLISRKAFEKVGGFDEHLSGYEDDDLFMRIFQAGYHNIYLNKALSKWRIHTESASYSYRMARSRVVYMRKLFDMFPDDPKRSRFYRRDLLVPRFRPHLVYEYLNALRRDDRPAIQFAAEQLRFIAQSSGRAHGRALRLLLKISDKPKLVKFAYSVRRPFRHLVLRRIT